MGILASRSLALGSTCDASGLEHDWNHLASGERVRLVAHDSEKVAKNTRMRGNGDV